MDEANRQRDMEWKEELEKRDQMWRNELQKRDQAYWQRQCKKDEDLVRILEGRDKLRNDELVIRDQLWLNCTNSFNDNLKSMYNDQNSMGSLAQRQVELIKDNVKMLDWAMTEASNKKKVAAPKVTISDYIPFIIQPPYEHAIKDP